MIARRITSSARFMTSEVHARLFEVVSGHHRRQGWQVDEPGGNPAAALGERVQRRVHREVAEVGARRVRQVRGNAVRGQLGRIARTGSVLKYAAGPPGTHGSSALTSPARVRHLVVHHVDGHALEAHARSAPGQPEVDDGGEIRGRSARGAMIRRASSCCTGRTRLRMVCAPDRATVHRLGELLRGVDGVAAEGLESGDEDVARGHHMGLTPVRWRWASAW